MTPEQHKELVQKEFAREIRTLRELFGQDKRTFITLLAGAAVAQAKMSGISKGQMISIVTTAYDEGEYT